MTLQHPIAAESNFFAQLATSGSLETTISPEMRSWIVSCPDVAKFQAALQEYMFLNKDDECAECGEPYKTKDLRYDVACPCGDPENLICKNCWTMYDEGTMGDPSYRPPPWPERLSLTVVPQPLVNGAIFDKTRRAIIGRVEGYNPKGHFAKKVILFGLESSAEAGSLDDDCVVVADDELVDLVATVDDSDDDDDE